MNKKNLLCYRKALRHVGNILWTDNDHRKRNRVIPPFNFLSKVFHLLITGNSINVPANSKKGITFKYSAPPENEKAITTSDAQVTSVILYFKHK